MLCTLPSTNSQAHISDPIVSSSTRVALPSCSPPAPAVIPSVTPQNGNEASPIVSSDPSRTLDYHVTGAVMTAPLSSGATLMVGDPATNTTLSSETPSTEDARPKPRPVQKKHHTPANDMDDNTPMSAARDSRPKPRPVQRKRQTPAADEMGDDAVDLTPAQKRAATIAKKKALGESQETDGLARSLTQRDGDVDSGRRARHGRKNADGTDFVPPKVGTRSQRATEKPTKRTRRGGK